MTNLGTKLLKLRQRQKLSQVELAEILGVSQNAYSRWEADKGKPLAENLMKVSQYYQIDIKELFDDREVYIQSSTELIESIWKTQEQIFRLLDSQGKLIAELLKKQSSVGSGMRPSPSG